MYLKHFNINPWIIVWCILIAQSQSHWKNINTTREEMQIFNFKLFQLKEKRLFMVFKSMYKLFTLQKAKNKLVFIYVQLFQDWEFSGLTNQIKYKIRNTFFSFVWKWLSKICIVFWGVLKVMNAEIANNCLKAFRVSDTSTYVEVIKVQVDSKGFWDLQSAW